MFAKCEEYILWGMQSIDNWLKNLFENCPKQGPPGKNGFPGLIGAQGFKGDTGLPGARGEEGKQGKNCLFVPRRMSKSIFVFVRRDCDRHFGYF